MRISTACIQCRRAKRRCIHPEADQGCAPCQARQLICEGKPGQRSVGHQTLIPRPSTTNTATSRQDTEECACQMGRRLGLSHGTAIELVDHYLDKFHGKPHTIFHPATLRSRTRNGALNKALLYTICAIGCKFSGNPDIRRQCLDLTSESKRLLQADISNICLENIQACILVAMLAVGHGDSASEALFFRIAAAMAEIMNLNSIASGGPDLDREIRQRVWWSLYMTDLWCITGQGLHSQMKDVEVMIELPTNDMKFMSSQSDQFAIGDPKQHTIWAQMITLVPIFRPIHNINRLVANGKANTIELDKEIEQLSQKLEEWKSALPLDAQMNRENLYRQQKNGLGGLLISVHLAYHHFSTLLYFRYLEEVQRPTSPPTTDCTYTARCKEHASSFSCLLRMSRQLKGCDVVYPNIGHMATVSSSVLVHTLLFGDLNELEIAREELNANFEALTELECYWPATSAMIERLVLFQDMCLLSTESGTHQLNGWMLRFLIEHSLDIRAKEMHLRPSGWDVDSARMSSKAREFAEQGRYMSFRSS